MSATAGTAGPLLELERPPDLVQLAGAARDAGQEVMLFERRAPEAVSVAGIGRRYELVSAPGGVVLEDGEGRLLDRESGPRLEAAARVWRRLTAQTAGWPGPPVAGPVALGGFAFDPEREPGPPWLGFPALLLRVPALTLVLAGGRGFAAGDLSLLPRSTIAAPGGAVRLATEPSPAEMEWKELVARTSRRLRQGGARKVVLAREVVVRGDRPISAGAVAGRLQLVYPTCYRYLVTGGDGSAFVGASPELLVRRSGAMVTCQPMAGSIGRGHDRAADTALAGRLQASAKDTAEHQLTVAHVVAALRRLGAQVTTTSPEVLRLPNIQHLATTVEAQLGDPPPGLLELAAALHPTPAVGGVPADTARPLIRELEGMERGWYAGAVGWIDARGNGELAVAIRCGLLWEDGARLYAGAGIMPDSDPEAELEETRLKLRALLDALGPG